MCLNVGERVRSFDFDSRALEGKSACFVEGVIEGIGKFEDGLDCERYKIKVDRQVYAGEELVGERSLVGFYVFPPKNGVRKLFGGECNAVVKI